MSFSDDHASPAAPFSGDETGQIFDAPDVVLQSPTTAERVVDTQSGFLVVIKSIEGRQSLSVKRRLGTPPASSIFLTPDESLKLSRILVGIPASADRRSRQLSPEAEEWLSSFENESAGSLSKNGSRSYKLVTGALRHIIAVSAVTVILIGGLVALGVQYAAHHVLPQFKTVAILPPDPLDTGKVDKFVRQFVSAMLDFNPATYKLSQIKAMATMAPDVVDTYWSDTHFPLTGRQLKTLPQDSNLVVSRINQQRLDGATTSVDIYGQLVSPSSKTGSPVHISLKLGLDPDKQIRVLSQKDVSTGSQP